MSDTFACPEFSLLGSDEKTYSLDDFSNTPYVLLYFYPKDNTPGCTVQAKDFSELQEKFIKSGIQIIGVSPDSVASHQNFIEKQNLKILLLSDPEKEFASALGAYGEKQNYGKTYMGIIRSTFYIDTQTKQVIKAWRNVRAKGHAERVLQETSSL